MARPKKVNHVVQNILGRVASEQLSAGAALPPNRQFARDLAVAHMTLHRAVGELIELGVLESQPRQRVVVCAAGRERAQELLRQARKSSGLERLTLLIHEFVVPAADLNSYWNKVIYQLKAEAALQGLETTVVPFPIKGQAEFIRALADRSQNVSVALGFTYEFLPGLVEVSKCGVPMLLHNRSLSWLQIPAVLRDDYAAAWRVGEILRGLGHRNMCMLMPEGWLNPLMGRDRLEGWRDFLRESGLFSQCNPAVLTMGHMTEQRAFLRRVLHGPEAPTAVIFAVSPDKFVFDPDCWGDLDIPRQLSVVTWDETIQVGLPGSEVPSTTVRVDHRRMSQCIIEMARKIEAGDLCPPNIRVRCDIEVTDSIGPPREIREQ